MGQVQDSMRIYSVDRKVWVGMETKDANTSPKNMELFNFADQDGNGEISKAELDRYNGPLLVENFPEKTARIIGHAGPFCMSGLIITDQEVDYYPGLQIEHVDKIGRVVYNKIDLNHDNVLSPKEMEKVTDAKQKIDEASMKLDKIENTRTILSALGIAGSIGFSGLGRIYSESNNIKEFFQIIKGTREYYDSKAVRAFAIASVACLGLALANRLVAKHKAKKVLNEVQDINHPYTEETKEKLKNIV